MERGRFDKVGVSIKGRFSGNFIKIGVINVKDFYKKGNFNKRTFL